MMGCFKRLLFVMLLVSLIGAIIIGSWAAYERTRDPLQAIDAGMPIAHLLHDSIYPMKVGDGVRRYRDVVLLAEELDTIRFTISFPNDLRDGERLPVVLVLGGLEIGRQSLRFVKNHGRNALLAYEYPYGPNYWYEGVPLGEIPSIRKAALRVPAQMEAMARWAMGEQWADTSRIVAFSYSFGAVFLPAFHRLAQAHGLMPRADVLIYGGADIELLFEHNLQIDSDAFRNLAAWGITTAIYPLEPANHLPHLRGEFLIINGRRDRLMPPESARRLQELMPEPKTVINLDTEHMDPSKTDLIDMLVEQARRWLLERNAINP
jgi:hypothetical protein